MVEIRRILCPIDFSDCSRRALQHAVAIAKWYESHITALHVIRPVFIPQPPVLFAAPAKAATSADRDALEQELRGWLEPAKQAGVKADLVFDEGVPASRIVDHVSKLQADLIVMGTHGTSGLERFMLGSVAERVLRTAGCPVMTVPPPVTGAGRIPYTKILCPVDFSDSSLTALQYAFSLAKESDARVTILHVFEWPAEAEMPIQGFDVPEYRRLIEGDARARLDALVTDDVRVWSKPETRVAHGKPYRRILEAAEADGADLIVMGVHGRNPLDMALFGSTTNHVVRRAPCPVLTLKQ
ncbi:MAG: universal stress protein [Betaproteobacteria bacterium]